MQEKFLQYRVGLSVPVAEDLKLYAKATKRSMVAVIALACEDYLLRHNRELQLLLSRRKRYEQGKGTTTIA